MGSGQSVNASHQTDILTLHRGQSDEGTTARESDLDTTIPKLDTSWSDDEDLNDLDNLRRDLDSALQSSPRHKSAALSTRGRYSKDSRFLLDSAEDMVHERNDFPETYAQKIQRVRLEDQQPAMLVREHIMVPRDPDEWEIEEEEILGFDAEKFKAVNKNNAMRVTSPSSTSVKTSTPRTNDQITYDRFEEEIMAAIERDF